jgi:hypothetical protein
MCAAAEDCQPHAEEVMKARLAMTILALGAGALGCSENESTAPAYTPLVFTADLDGSAQRPTAVDVPATGTGTFTVTTGTSPFFNPTSDERKIITYSLAVGDLSGQAVKAQIHGPADEGAAADVLVPLTVTSTDSVGVIASGTFTATSNPAVSMDSLVSLLRTGNAYVSIQTAAFPAGEIRGQIRPQ